MREIVDDRLLFQNALREVRGMRQWVLDAEHILSANFVGDRSEVSNLMVAQHFDSWRQSLTFQLKQDGFSPLQQQCLEQFLQVLSNQRSHLIQCYDHQEFPRTNNEMERRIRAIKTRYRRISGRKNWNSYLLRYGRCVAFYVVNSANVRRFLARNIGIDQQDAGETAPHLGYQQEML